MPGAPYIAVSSRCVGIRAKREPISPPTEIVISGCNCCCIRSCSCLFDCHHIGISCCSCSCCCRHPDPERSRRGRTPKRPPWQPPLGSFNPYSPFLPPKKPVAHFALTLVISPRKTAPSFPTNPLTPLLQLNQEETKPGHQAGLSIFSTIDHTKSKLRSFLSKTLHTF